MIPPVQSSIKTARVSVGTYSTYTEAQQAMDRLADHHFPVERSAIVAENLRFVEQVTGRLNWARSFWYGALSGASTGLLIGFIFGLFNWLNPLISAINLALTGLAFGFVIGGLIGALMYGFSGGRRDFSSISQMQAERYQVMVDTELENQALSILQGARKP